MHDAAEPGEILRDGGAIETEVLANLFALLGREVETLRAGEIPRRDARQQQRGRRDDEDQEEREAETPDEVASHAWITWLPSPSSARRSTTVAVAGSTASGR